MDRPYILQLHHIRKTFGAVVALGDVSFAVRPGSVHALLGENGAGKTTLMRVAYGLTRPDAGRIELDGRPRAFHTPGDAIAAGVGMVHQHFTLVPSMTVQENLALGGHGILSKRTMRARVYDVAARTGFALEADTRVDALPVGAQQRVEIAKAIAGDPAILILDEPTAVLTPAEVDELLHWLRRYVSDGHSVVLITHKLREALAVADDVSVMRHGRVVLTVRAGDTTADQLTTAMLGESIRSYVSTGMAEADPAAPVRFEARDLAVADESGREYIHSASFTVRAGEIVGIAAIEGAGHHELLRALAGRLSVACGQLTRPSIVAYIPADRHRDAVLLDRDLTENVALAGAGSACGAMNWSTLRMHTQELMVAFDVRAPDVSSALRKLSGGNQQKLVVARELSITDPKQAFMAIVADNPTRGLDVRASAMIHERLRAAAVRGAAVVLYSSDLDEVLALATRVLVVRDGSVLAVPLDRDVIGRTMIGAQTP